MKFVSHTAGYKRTYLEAWQEAIVSLVTSVSLGKVAVHHHHSKCLGDGNLWESHTLCHWSDTYTNMKKDFKCVYVSYSEHGTAAVGTGAKLTVLKGNTCPLTAYFHLHKTPLHCNTPQRSDLHQTPPPYGWWDGVHPRHGT